MEILKVLLMLPTLFPAPIAVIDVETTGLFPLRHDRIVEVAVVVLNTNGQIEREFVSLVNPSRDIGPTSIHGLASGDILHAPPFGEIAALLVDSLNGCVAIAAHNVRFDRQFLECEFNRMGFSLPELFSICTMQLAGGGKLRTCCSDYGVPVAGDAHSALADARAAAGLLVSLLPDQTRAFDSLQKLSAIQWPTVPRSPRQPITRDESRQRQSEPPTYLQRLLGRKQDNNQEIATDGAVLAYGALLDRVLEDRVVEDWEADALVEMAERWGISADQIRQAHHSYLNQLAIAALADGIVTDTERRDLKLVARLLGLEEANLENVLNEAATMMSKSSLRSTTASVAEQTLAGKRVCFTGEMQCSYRGQVVTREYAAELATNAGLTVVDSVTKKLDLLIVTDPQTQSGKAKKARQYGVRIMHEPVFWKALGLEVN